jgi:2-succinyl-5-enolpyruvyl-6-hydroxy-3-cyclohexene-1-carboxylate synthase
MSDPNLNYLSARIAIEECVRRGCRTVVVCPGSRSAPLAVAAGAWRGRTSASGGAIDVIVAHDERGAAFLALGAARASGRAAVVITTSGTAVANLLPAAVEASMDGIPMLLFTADRPHELHGCGANQSVPQSGMLAPVVRAALDVECPDDPGSTPIDALDAVASAWDAAHGGTAGPVHVNWRFREPLAPTRASYSIAPDVAGRLAAWQASREPWDREVANAPRALAVAESGPVPATGLGTVAREGIDGWCWASDRDVDALIAQVAKAARGVVVAGGARSPSEAAELVRIASLLPWPVVADITSGLRSGEALPNVVHHADLALCDGGVADHDHARVREALRPDLILRVGGRVTSKRVQQWIDECASTGCTLAVAGDGVEPMDPSQRASLRVRTCTRRLADRIAAGAPRCSGIRDAWARADAAVAHALALAVGHGDRQAGPIREPELVRSALAAAHRAGAIAMLSSSMPVRDADMHSDRAATPVCIANRGASGIDGIVATAAGACRAGGRPVVLLIGDVAALHDLSSWSLLRDLPAPMCVIVVNNDGGGIFRFLPIASHPSVYSPWFDSPHGLTFGAAAAMFSLPYAMVSTDAEWADAIHAGLSESGGSRPGGPRHSARIIEARTSADGIVPDHRRIQATCADAVRDALAMRAAQGAER